MKLESSFCADCLVGASAAQGKDLHTCSSVRQLAISASAQNQTIAAAIQVNPPFGWAASAVDGDMLFAARGFS
jgi:hypothetical protein